MAGQDKRAALKAEVAEGVLRIPGQDGEWHHDPFRTLWVEVTNLALYQTVSVEEGVATRTPRLVGKGRIQKDDLRLAGWGDRCRDLPVTIKPAIPQEDGQGYKPFTAVVGFIPADPELRSVDAWFLEAWIQQEDMDRMIAAYRAGEMPSFFVGTKLDLWIRRGDEHTPPGYGVTWHLVPAQRRESSFPEAAHGTVTMLSWGDAARSEVPGEDGPGPDPAPSLSLAIPASATVPDMAALTAAVDRLRQTVLRVGVAIAGAVVVGWFL